MTNIAVALAASLLTFATHAPANANDQTQADRMNAPIAGLEKRPMRARDLVTMPRLGGQFVDPEHRAVVYPVTYTDPQTFERMTSHYLLDLTNLDAAPRLVDPGFPVRSPAFAPDGSLYFLSDSHPDPAVAERSRLWRAPKNAASLFGEPDVVAEFEHTDIAHFLLAPNGSRVALMAKLARECERFDCAAGEPGTGTGRLYDGEAGFYRHWDEWVQPGHYNRVFVFDISNDTIVPGGVPIDGRDADAGLTGNTPTAPFGGLDDLAWAPDGSGLYFTARETGRAEPGSTDLDIWYSDLSGGAPVELTAQNQAYDSTPAVSPDGQRLAYLAMERPGYESDRRVVMLRNLASGETRALTSKADISFGSLTWSVDGRHILATAPHVLDVPAFTIDPETGAVAELDLIAGDEAHIGNLVALSGERLLFTRDSIGAPPELYLAQGHAQAKPLTNIVTTAMGRMATTMTTRFSFAGADGDTVHGQITRLENQRGPIPVVLYVHGGPQGTFNDGWSSRWNPRAVASQGYAVVSVDFHGSVGYGQEFTDAINRDWGGKPLEDLQRGLAAALQLDPQIDGSRACAMGASYGGYMVNWIAGNWPDRFDCLIQHDGLFDLRSFYYSTEELWFPRWDFGGSYSDARETYERWNPVNYVENWRTPMLVIAGEQDFRVPYTQGLQSFTALQERDVPAQLLVFPDENHWVLGAANSLQWHHTVFDWLDRWIGPDAGKERGE